MKKGFTLLETMIAMVILSGGLILLANSWGGSFMMLRKSQLNYDVGLLLERKMSEIEMEYRGKSLTEIPPEDTGEFGNEYPQFTWKLESKEMTFPDLSSAMVSAEGGADQSLVQMIQQMSDYISKSVKEVKVSVLYKASGDKVLTYSATTYFVDYTQEFQLGLPGGMGGL